MDMVRKEQYENAMRAVKAHRIREAFELYVSLFLPSCHRTKEFVSFYRTQMASYLILKKSCRLALSEGDMVSDLIEMVYDDTVRAIENSEIPLSPDGRMNILSSVEIVFPCQMDTGISESRKCVAK